MYSEKGNPNENITLFTPQFYEDDSARTANKESIESNNEDEKLWKHKAKMRYQVNTQNIMHQDVLPERLDPLTPVLPPA